jgi:hypothetical protein
VKNNFDFFSLQNSFYIILSSLITKTNLYKKLPGLRKSAQNLLGLFITSNAFLIISSPTFFYLIFSRKRNLDAENCPKSGNQAKNLFDPFPLHFTSI